MGNVVNYLFGWLCKNLIVDVKYFKQTSGVYKIIPFGEYCLPRVITTINGLKPSRENGEESFPFDLCFSKFEDNLKLFCNGFEHFYNGVQYNNDKNCWDNRQTKMLFNHDSMSLLDDFKQRYDNRIKNLYTVLENENKFIFFLVATWSPIPQEKIQLFIKEILKYRKAGTFAIIVVNQSSQEMCYKIENVYCKNLHKDKTFAKINKDGNWVEMLKEMRDINAIIFNYKVVKFLSKIIKLNLG